MQEVKSYIEERTRASDVLPRIPIDQTEIISTDFGTFVFVTANDVKKVSKAFFERLKDASLKTEEAFSRAYQLFFDKQLELLDQTYSTALKDNFSENIIYPLEVNNLEQVLARKVKKYALENNLISVSLEEGCNFVDFSFGYSRSFDTEGKNKIGSTARPGYVSISEQLIELKELIKRKDVEGIILLDDYIFTGNTMREVTELFKANDIKIEKMFSLAQVGDINNQINNNLELESMIKFGGRNIYERLELVEIGYFTFFRGCVVYGENRKPARSPYFLPFSNPSERASIPVEEIYRFSVATLRNNLELFENLSKLLGREILVSDVPRFINERIEWEFGVSSETQLKNLIKQKIEEVQRLSADNFEKKNNYIQKLSKLKLPSKTIFIDINKTLVSPGQSFIESDSLQQLKVQINLLREGGISVGLCSDSPLSGLKRFAEYLEIDGPLIYENGSGVYFNERKVILREVRNISSIKKVIRKIAKEMDYVEEEPRFSVEFGGEDKLMEQGVFYFGAGRELSLSLFANDQLINVLSNSEELKSLVDVQNTDVSPNVGNYGYFAIHSSPITEGKRLTLRAVSRLQDLTYMIGDSITDCAELGSDFRTSLVANHSVKKRDLDSLYRVIEIAELNYAEGVIELLEGIKDRNIGREMDKMKGATLEMFE